MANSGNGRFPGPKQNNLGPKQKNAGPYQKNATHSCQRSGCGGGRSNAFPWKRQIPWAETEQSWPDTEKFWPEPEKMLPAAVRKVSAGVAEVTRSPICAIRVSPVNVFEAFWMCELTYIETDLT